MKVKINIPDRFVMISILPETGNFETMSTIEDLSKKLYPSQEEVEKYNIKQEGTRVSWNSEANEEKELEFTEKEVDLIKREFKKLSDEDKLTLQQFATYKKFVE